MRTPFDVIQVQDRARTEAARSSRCRQKPADCSPFPAASLDEVHDRLGLDKNNRYSSLFCPGYCLYTYRHHRRHALSLPSRQRHERFHLQIPDRYIPSPASRAIAETDSVRCFF